MLLLETNSRMDDVYTIIERIAKNKTDSLNLSGRELTILPPNVATLTQLKNLYLDNNKLIFIPEIGSLIQLEDLSLENNQLTLIPESFYNLKSLRSLNLNRNHLSSLSSNFFASLANLTVLWLNGCELLQIPDEIGLLKSLERLGLKENRLEQLPDQIGQLVNLKWLSVEKNSLEYLPDSMRNLKDLSHLNVSFNKLDQVPRFLYDMTHLNIVLLRNNRIRTFSDEDIVALSFLHKMDLRENPFVKKAQTQDPDFYSQLLCLTNFLIDQSSE